MPTPDPMTARISRRSFLQAAALVGGAAAAGLVAVDVLQQGSSAGTTGAATPAGAAASASPVLVAAGGATPGVSGSAAPASAAASATADPGIRFVSRPDLVAPALHVTTPAAGVAPGSIFFTPSNGSGRYGPTIMANDGALVWMRPDTGQDAANFGVQRYRGQPVLTWWEGSVNGGNGDGEHVIVDAAYREIARVRVAGGYRTDLHELLITPADTALVLGGIDRPGAITASGAAGVPVWDDVVQEVDIRTGAVLFEWHAMDHIDVAESYAAAPTNVGDAWDYVHTNSIEVDADGNLLVSARNTSTIYKINRVSGRIMWRLGGRRSDFAIAPGASFGWQHDARRRADGTLTLFDDETPPTNARGLVLRLDETAMTCSLVRAFDHQAELTVTSQGNMQLLPNGNVFIGWGASPWFTEFDPMGRILFDATFPGATQSYRAFRFPWAGRPADEPALGWTRGADAKLTAFVSWNGATDVAAWQILAGDIEDALTAAVTAPRNGFETSVVVDRPGTFLAAVALDAAGAILGRSAIVDLG